MMMMMMMMMMMNEVASAARGSRAIPCTSEPKSRAQARRLPAWNMLCWKTQNYLEYPEHEVFSMTHFKLLAAATENSYSYSLIL